MKKIILQLMMIFVSAQCFAAEAVFDFSTPSSLKTTTGERISVPAGGSVVISDKSFVEQGIVLTFLANGGVSPSISNTVYEGYNYRLNFFSGNTMAFETTDGRTIKSIWCEALNLGDWGLLNSSQPGRFKSGDPLHTWICDGQAVTKVVFGNSYVASRIWKIHVEYSDPLPIIHPDSCFFEDAPESLTKFVLTYSSPVGEKSVHDKILLKGETLEKPVEMSVAIEGRVVTLTPSEPIKKEGSYTITVPQETFYNLSTGATNEQDTYPVTISHATFSCTFLPGENENLTFPISLAFPSQIGKNEPYGYRLFVADDEGNETLATVLNATKSDDDNKILLLSLPETISPLEPGNYRLKVAAKSVYNVGLEDPEEGRYNPEMTVNYVITVPVDELISLKATAETLLSGHGVGYPADDDPAREALIVAISKTADTDEAKEELKTEIKNAIQTLCSAEVILPDTVTYKIFAINANRDKAWLSYNKNDGIVKLVVQESQASPFLLTKIDGVYEFKTSDSKYYLHVLTTNTNNYVSPKNTILVEGSSADNVFKNITIAKLTGVEGVDATVTYGQLSLTGAVDITSGLSIINSTAAVDFTTNPYSVVESPTTVLYFDDSKSSAFGFIETDVVEEPDSINSDLVRVNIGCSLKGSSEYLDEYNIQQPRVNNKQEEFELTFAEDIKSVELTYPDHIYYTNEGNEIIGQATLRNVEGTTYKVDVSVLNEGDFYFVIDEAALTVEIEGREEKVTNRKISLPFRIAGTTTEESTEDMEKQTINASLTASVLSSGDPLTLTFTGYQNVVFANSTATFIANAEKVEQCKANITGSGSVYTLNVVGLPAGDYYLIIPEGTLSCLPNDADQMVTNTLLELPFTILTNSTEPSDMTEFNLVNIPYSFLPSFARGEKYVTSYFKDIYFFIEDYYTYGELYADTLKVLEIKRDYDGDSAAPQAAGHLIPTTLPSEFIPNFTHNTYKLVYDVKALPEQLKDDKYRLIVPVGTFGDVNYGKYLGIVPLQDGEPKPKKSDCNVNIRIDWQFSIDETTGIDNISTDSPKVIYDLQGRLVSTPTKGVYILNGRKVVVK